MSNNKKEGKIPNSLYTLKMACNNKDVLSVVFYIVKIPNHFFSIFPVWPIGRTGLEPQFKLNKLTSLFSARRMNIMLSSF